MEINVDSQDIRRSDRDDSNKGDQGRRKNIKSGRLRLRGTGETPQLPPPPPNLQERWRTGLGMAVRSKEENSKSHILPLGYKEYNNMKWSPLERPEEKGVSTGCTVFLANSGSERNIYQSC